MKNLKYIKVTKNVLKILYAKKNCITWYWLDKIKYNEKKITILGY